MLFILICHNVLLLFYHSDMYNTIDSDDFSKHTQPSIGLIGHLKFNDILSIASVCLTEHSLVGVLYKINFHVSNYNKRK